MGNPNRPSTAADTLTTIAFPDDPKKQQLFDSIVAGFDSKRIDIASQTDVEITGHPITHSYFNDLIEKLGGPNNKESLKQANLADWIGIHNTLTLMNQYFQDSRESDDTGTWLKDWQLQIDAVKNFMNNVFILENGELALSYTGDALRILDFFAKKPKDGKINLKEVYQQLGLSGSNALPSKFGIRERLKRIIRPLIEAYLEEHYPAIELFETKI